MPSGSGDMSGKGLESRLMKRGAGELLSKNASPPDSGEPLRLRERNGLRIFS